MKKEAVVSGLVTIAVSAGVLLVSPKWALIIFVAFSVLTVLVQLLWKERVPHERTTEAVTVRGSFNPSNTQTQTANPSLTANPSINNSPTFNNAPVFAPQIVFAPPHQPAAPSVNIAPPKEDARHNLVFLGATFVQIAYFGPGFSKSTDGMHSFSEVAGTAGITMAPESRMIGLVARFRNEAIFGQDIKAIREARAHLKLFDKKGREIGTGFSAALWLAHSGDTFDLIPNGRGGSVLVCWGTRTKANVSWKSRVAAGRLHDNEIELSDGYPSRAEVTILDSVDHPLLQPITLDIIEEQGHLTVTPRLSPITHAPTQGSLDSALRIEWHPDEDEYVHKYPPGTTDNIHYRLKVVNMSDRYLTDVNVKLERLIPRTLDCVPCDLHIMNDNQGDPGDQNQKTFSLTPNGGYEFIDLLLQWPNGQAFWIWHTVSRQPREIPVQGYTVTILASAANAKDERKSFRLVRVGPIWNMVEI